MSELNATTQLVGAALTQIYQYQVFEGREIMRRFFVANSRDVEVRQARNRMLNQGVPEECLIADLWDCQPERVMGDGNRTMELAIAQQLMQYRNLYDPEPQREILRDVTLAITRDPARAKNLVPDQPQVSDSVMAAQYSAAALMLGLPMPVKSGINHQEYIEALLADMAILMKNIGARDNMGTPAELKGLQGIAQNIAQHIQLLSQDEAEGELVRKYGEQLGQLINALKGFAQRLSEKMQSQNGDGNELDPEVMAKIQAMLIQAKAKAENARESHAQKTAQRQVQFEQETQQRQAADALDLQKKATENALDLAVTREKAKHESEKPEPAVGK